MIRRQVPFSAVSAWRKVLIVCCIAASVLAGAMLADFELDLYSSAPDHPVAESGDVYRINLNHGFTRYVTLQDKTRLESYQSNSRNVCGLAMLAAFFLWITFKDAANQKQPGPRVNVRNDSRHT
jgi:hypothetical protein